MKEIYFVTATNTDVGKSYACSVFLKKFAKEGKRVGYLKPFETGVVDIPVDGNKLLTLVKELNGDFDMGIEDVVPYRFKTPASPFVASGGVYLDISIIKNTIDKLLKYCDTLIIEGAGGLMVPINRDYFILDLIKDIQDRYDSKTLLIAPSNLGSINDTLLSQRALESKGIKYEWFINLYRDKNDFEKITLPFYKEYFDKINFL